MKKNNKAWKGMSKEEKRDVILGLSVLGIVPMGFMIGFGQAIFMVAMGWIAYAGYKVIKTDVSFSKKALMLFGLFIVLGFTGSVTGASQPNSSQLIDKNDKGRSNVQPVSNHTDKKSEPKKTEQKKHEDDKSKKYYEVVAIVDGDTIKVQYETRVENVRLIGVDSPETSHPSKPVECFGKEATDYMTKLLSGKRVRLEDDTTQGDKDKYDRLLRFVYLEDGTHINEKMIRDGYAFEYTYNSNPYRYQSKFKDAQKEARDRSRGLWSAGACNGEQKPASSQTSSKPQPSTSTNTKPQPAPSTPPAAGPVVKKSTNNICHAPGTTYYERTKNFTPYNSLQACLNSGGRLPKR